MNYLVISNGSIIHGYTTEIKKKLEETKEDIVGFALPEFRERFQSDSKEVILEETQDNITVKEQTEDKKETGINEEQTHKKMKSKIFLSLKLIKIRSSLGFENLETCFLIAFDKANLALFSIF